MFMVVPDLFPIAMLGELVTSRPPRGAPLLPALHLAPLVVIEPLSMPCIDISLEVDEPDIAIPVVLAPVGAAAAG
jgi:hypothetical protein